MEILQVFANESTAAKRRVYFDIRSNVDNETPMTGISSGQPQVSSDGGSWTNTGIGTMTEIGLGRYYADLTQTLVLTAGTIICTRYAQSDSLETVGTTVQVVANAPYTALNNLSQADIRTATGLASANLDTQIATLAPASTALSTATWTSARAGYLDNLNGLRIKKNTALNAFTFLMVLASDHITPATGLTVTAQRSLDGAAFANCANAVSEISSGVYKINLATTDLNANTVTLKFTEATCDQRTIVIITEP